MADLARKRGVNGIICGHIHHAEIREVGDILYCNDGDWVESCTAMVEHADGRMEIIDWTKVRDLSMIESYRGRGRRGRGSVQTAAAAAAATSAPGASPAPSSPPVAAADDPASASPMPLRPAVSGRSDRAGLDDASVAPDRRVG